MNNEIRVLKLINGEHYIGKANFISDEQVWKLENAVSIEMQPTQTGMTVGFLPVSYFVEAGDKGNTVVLNDTHVLHVDKPSQQIYNAYNSKFGSGLVGTTGPGLITE